MHRRGFGAIFLVLLAVVLLLVWAGAQHFVTSSVRRRVRVAEAERAATLQALSAAEQLTVLLPALVAMQFGPAPEQARSDDVRRLSAEVGAGLAAWTPEHPLKVQIPLPWMVSSMKHVPVRLATSQVLAHMVAVEGGPRAPFEASRDCPRYAALVADPRFAAGAEDPAFLSERERRFPGWGPVEITGLGEVRTTSTADLTGVPLQATASLLRQFQLTASPCPEVDDGEPVFALAVHPIELARTVKVHRGPARGAP